MTWSSRIQFCVISQVYDSAHAIFNCEISEKSEILRNSAMNYINYA